MQDTFDIEKIENHIKKIEFEVVNLLKILTNEKIPTRSSLISKDYYGKLQSYGFLNSEQSRKTNEDSTEIEEPKDTKELIKKILTHIPDSLSERQLYLEKLMSYFTEISFTDKSVLIESLLHESAEKIKSAVNEIVEAFKENES